MKMEALDNLCTFIVFVNIRLLATRTLFRLLSVTYTKWGVIIFKKENSLTFDQSYSLMFWSKICHIWWKRNDENFLSVYFFKNIHNRHLYVSQKSLKVRNLAVKKANALCFIVIMFGEKGIQCRACLEEASHPKDEMANGRWEPKVGWAFQYF